MIPLAITGLGVVSAIGIGKEAFFGALAAPVSRDRSHSRALESFDAARYPDAANLVVEALAFDAAKYLGDKGLRSLDRMTKLLVVATRLALHDAGVKKDGAFVALSPETVGLICSNAYGSLEAITELDRVAKLEDARYINPAKFPNTVSNSASGYASIWEDLRALNVSVSDGNCGALDAIACAEIQFASERADALVVGGAEAMSEPLYLAFRRLGALDHDARIGEGACMVVLEPAELAAARGASVDGEIIGYGTAFGPAEGHALLFPSSEAIETAIRDALEDAQVDPSAIDIVASGIAGLKLFDDVELAAIRRVLGDEVRVETPKLLLGETLGAGGAMAIGVALSWLKSGAAPTPGDGSSSGAARASIDTVLVTSMGYYGNASAVVVRRAPPRFAGSGRGQAAS